MRARWSAPIRRYWKISEQMILDEPVREEDSFSKESMSQESEISENILLPDLAKQSESIEQQSGEIAERGMPT